MTPPELPEMFALLVFGHMLADYPLQGDFLSKAKNRFHPLAGMPWYQAMLAHSVIHGGLVGLVTGSLWLGLAETAVHWLIDDAKCAGRIGFNCDQLLHIGSKLLWVALIWLGIS